MATDTIHERFVSLFVIDANFGTALKMTRSPGVVGEAHWRYPTLIPQPAGFG